VVECITAHRQPPERRLWSSGNGALLQKQAVRWSKGHIVFPPEHRSLPLRSSSPCTWRHFEPAVLGCSVRWDWRSSLSYRDVAELMLARGLHVAHTTVFRWGQRYAPPLDQRCRPARNVTTDSSRVDETSVNIKKPWHSLYRAVDSTGATWAFMLSPTREAAAAARFFRKVLGACHTTVPRVITVDKNYAASSTLGVS
jgi:transposase, IS6 family